MYIRLHFMKVAIGCDHAGFELKEAIKTYLTDKGLDISDFGAYSTASVDYPDFAHAVAKAVTDKQASYGILICGSGNGISIAANKHADIRAALCWKPEIAELARLHNDANILSLPARFISSEDAMKCVDVFVATAFEGGRHQGRVNKINC
jgi:ribose 5-phosphate isomerase B